LQNAENVANTTQTLSFVSLFFGLDGFASFLSSWFCTVLRVFLTSWLCLCSHFRRNQSHKRKEITNTAYTQTKTTTSTVVGLFLQLHHRQQQLQQQQQQQKQQQQETTITTTILQL